MKIFFRKNDIETHIHRKFYAEWIKPIFPRARHYLYGLQTEDLVTSESIEDSDMLILPLTWNYYLEYGKLNVAIKLIKEYERYKNVLFNRFYLTDSNIVEELNNRNVNDIIIVDKVRIPQHKKLKFKKKFLNQKT